MSFELEIFTAGHRTSSQGFGRKYSTDDLDQAVNCYNPDVFKAPLIISKRGGHDTGGIPDHALAYSELAFGYPQSLKRIGQKLIAIFEKVAPEFVQWCDEGRILDRSASFYLPDSPNNPHPGSLALRHVAALGVSPPAVKGMGSIQGALSMANFTCSAEDVGVVEFDSGDGSIAQVFWNLREWIISKHGLEAADVALPKESIAAILTMDDEDDEEADDETEDSSQLLLNPIIKEQLTAIFQQYIYDAGITPLSYQETMKHPKDQQENIATDAKTPTEPMIEEKTIEDKMIKDKTEPKFAEPAIDIAEFRELQKTVKVLQAENSALKIDSQIRAIESEKFAVTSFVEEQVREARVLPDDKEMTIAKLMAMPTTSIDFAESSTTPRRILMDDIASRKPLYGKTTLPESANFSEGITELGITIPDGFTAEPESARLFLKARAYEVEHNVSFVEALTHVGGSK
jgi:hypothetical protein